MKNRDIFEVYAHEYDLITNASARLKYHRKEVQALIDHYHPQSVLDAGCATGLTAMLFARRGVKAVGLDRSAKMLIEARMKYGRLGYPLTFRRGHFEKLPESMSGTFDLVVCLANSISGVGSVANLLRSLKSFHRVLRPGGSLVLQALNYASMKEGDLFPIKATRNKGIVYLRYARRVGKRLGVHVVRLDLSARPPKFEPFCHEFDNYTAAQLTSAARIAGFTAITRWSDLFLSKRFTRTSRDLVLTARRNH